MLDAEIFSAGGALRSQPKVKRSGTLGKMSEQTTQAPKRRGSTEWVVSGHEFIRAKNVENHRALA
jgi:hypothetical protein